MLRVLLLAAAAVSAQSTFAHAGNFGKLWRNIRERTVWRNDITQAATASRVAYCTLLFADLAAPVIDVLNPDIVVKVPKGKRNKRR